MTQLSRRGGVVRDRALRAGKGLKTCNPVFHAIDQLRGVPPPTRALARDSQGLLGTVRLRWVGPLLCQIGVRHDRARRFHRVDPPGTFAECKFCPPGSRIQAAGQIDVARLLPRTEIRVIARLNEVSWLQVSPRAVVEPLRTQVLGPLLCRAVAVMSLPTQFRPIDARSRRRGKGAQCWPHRCTTSRA